ncbi:MAG TPA: 30S ribosomal protein S8 [Candidatus Hydrogenedentes bacterium]|nr:30S ribosomal protein S8 [Candidatus Hydrogenedentota bacterium]HIJ73791.1 30S ribosomal protein S8 [Candidatus Hydrogenedentota bacterium]
MSMSDPIADMLTRIRNAVQAGQASVEIPASRVKREICEVLKKEGYIRDYALKDRGLQGILEVELKYMTDRSPVLQGIQRVSKPSLRVYVRGKNIQPVRSGLGVSILSTSKGIMTGKQALAARLGGEVLCEVW